MLIYRFDSLYITRQRPNVVLFDNILFDDAYVYIYTYIQCITLIFVKRNPFFHYQLQQFICSHKTCPWYMNRMVHRTRSSNHIANTYFPARSTNRLTHQVTWDYLIKEIYSKLSGTQYSYWTMIILFMYWSLQWRHNGRDGVSNNQPHDYLLNRLFRRRSKKISKLRVTGLCPRNSTGTGEFPAQMASNAENVSIWWRHHVDTSNCGYLCSVFQSRVCTMFLE